MALFGRALSALRSGDLEKARSMAEEGLAICRAIGDAWFISYFLWLLATAAVETGDLETARRSAEESLVVARRVEGPLLIVCALDALAGAARASGDQPIALASLEEARSSAAGGGVPTSYVSSIVKGLGELAAERGDFESAKLLLESAVEMAGAVGDPWAVARALLGLAQVTNATDPAAAADLLAQALTLQAEIGARLGVAETLEVCAWVAAQGREFRRATKLLATADGLRDAVGAVRSVWRRQRCEETARAARADLGDEGYAAAVAEAAAETWETAVLSALKGM